MPQQMPGGMPGGMPAAAFGGMTPEMMAQMQAAQLQAQMAQMQAAGAYAGMPGSPYGPAMAPLAANPFAGPVAQPVTFGPLGVSGGMAPGAGNTGLDLIMDVPLRVTVELGRTRMQIRDVLELGKGSVVELDKLAGEPVDLLVNGKLIARGEVVVIDENFGIRVTDIVSPAERVSGFRGIGPA
jgi:flagellar motor switch protein FliN/FliY